MRRLFLCDLNVFVILCKGEEEKEKCEETWAIFRVFLRIRSPYIMSSLHHMYINALL